MSLEIFLAFVVFAFVSSVTPGPNNFILLASGVNFGFLRTAPHMLGISAGFATLLLGVGFGLGAMLKAYPSLHLALKIVGGSYLLYLAWRIATSRSLAAKGEARGWPMSFMEAAAFQWVNPKAWVLAVTGMTVYTDPREPFASILLVTAAFTLVNLPSISVWAGFGTALRGFLGLTLWPMLR